MIASVDDKNKNDHLAFSYPCPSAPRKSTPRAKKFFHVVHPVMMGLEIVRQEIRSIGLKQRQASVEMLSNPTDSSS